MKDRVPANPNRFLITPEDGSPPFYGTLTRADNPLVEGTLLDKATLLPDSVEEAIWGSAADRTPAQALQQMRSLISTAQSTANSAYGKINIVSGSYEGTSTNITNPSKVITLSFTPKFFFVKLRGQLDSWNTSYYQILVVAFSAGNDLYSLSHSSSSYGNASINLSGNGGTISGRTVTITTAWLNFAGGTYDYFAIG